MQNAQLSNNVGTQESRGRRWVRRVGARALREPYAPMVFIGAAVFTGIVGILIGTLVMNAIVSLFAAAFNVSICLAVAALSYERKNFYEIILEQEQRIAELEQSLQHTR